MSTEATPSTPATPAPEAATAPTETPVAETAPELEASTPNTEAPKVEEKKPNKKKLKLKIDGKDIEEEFDLDNDEELTKQFQMAKSAHKRMEEAAQMRKDFEHFIGALQKDPAEVLKALGMNVDEFTEKYLDTKLQEMQKTPEQKEKERLEKELDKYKKEIEAAKKAQEEAMKAKLQTQVAKEIDDDITAALQNSPDLPKSPYVVKRIAEAMMVAFEKGFTEVKVNDVLPIVKKQIQAEWQQMFGALPEDILESVVGKNNIDRLRKNRLKQQKQQVTEANKVVPTGKVDPKREEKPKEKIRAKDFFKTLGKV